MYAYVCMYVCIFVDILRIADMADDGAEGKLRSLNGYLDWK